MGRRRIAAGLPSGRRPFVACAVLLAGVGLVACHGGPGGPSATVSPLSGPTTTTSTVPASPEQVSVPSDAPSAAARITAVERALRSPATPAAQIPALGWEQQAIYRALAGNPSWLPEVVAAVPPDVATIVTANTGGGSSISALLDPPATLPTSWRIVTPAPAASLLAAYHEAEAASGIPWTYLAAINLVETRMGRIVGDSTAGAQGPMQFIPSTWRAYGRGGDVHDPRDAILAAGRYLAAAGGPKDMDAALRAYNHADAYVDAVKRYASVMAADERAFLGYYQWQVLFRTTDGLFLLPEGYPAVAAVRVS
ncbi:MAG TPA: lytic transglycosylase domain-containing protein [Acidimicrobiales bacterium]